MAREFFNAVEAAAELQRLTNLGWTAAQVLREAEDGNLPICFQYRGKLGVFDRQDSDPRRAIFGKALRTLYLPRGNYLRVQGTPTLAGVHQKQDKLLPRNLEALRPSKVSGATEINIVPSESLRIVADSGPWKDVAAMSFQVPSTEWFFHSDDLTKLVAATQAGPDMAAAPHAPSARENPVQSAPAQKDLPPSESVQMRKKKETLQDFLMPYLVEVFRGGTYRSAKELYKALTAKAGTDNSPFKAGTGRTNHLYVTERGQTLADGTLNRWIARVRKEAAS